VIGVVILRFKLVAVDVWRAGFSFFKRVQISSIAFIIILIARWR
jgi:hypothetical protein